MWKEKIVNSIAAWRVADASRASDVGEQRDQIADLLELTNVNKKALSWIRVLDKMEADKRDDVLRSFDALREHVMQPHWDGQSTPDMFSDPPVAPVAEEGPRKPSYKPTLDVADPEIAAEADDFTRHLAEVMPEDAK
jgi:hypothetical protein